MTGYAIIFEDEKGLFIKAISEYYEEIPNASIVEVVALRQALLSPSQSWLFLYGLTTSCSRFQFKFFRFISFWSSLNLSAFDLIFYYRFISKLCLDIEVH